MHCVPYQPILVRFSRHRQLPRAMFVSTQHHTILPMPDVRHFAGGGSDCMRTRLVLDIWAARLACLLLRQIKLCAPFLNRTVWGITTPTSLETSCQFTLWCFCYYTSHSIRHLTAICIHSHRSNHLITRPSHSRCSRIRASEKRPRPRNRQRLPGCLRGHLIPGKLRAESGRTELFAVGSGNTAAINDAGAFRYRGRHSRGEILSRGSVHLLSLSGCSDFSCPNCPNGLVRDDDAAVLKILS